MIRAFTVNNFRGLHRLHIAPLLRVNLLTGRNAVGKTSLLEALWLHHGRHNPMLFWNQHVLRGPIPNDLNPLVLLAGRNATHVDLSAEQDSPRMTTRVALRAEPLSGLVASAVGASEVGATATSAIPTSDEGPVVGGASLPSGGVFGRFRFMVEVTDGEAPAMHYVGRMRSSREGSIELSFDPPHSVVGTQASGVFLATKSLDPFGTVDRFSTALKGGVEGDVISVLRHVEPRLERLDILTELGRPALWGTLKSGDVLPVSQLGDGLGRLLSLVVSLFVARKGIILVDEAENGIHHSAMEPIWKAVGELAERLDVQVFATTHSRECVVAAYNALGTQPESPLALHQLYRKEEGVGVETYSGGTLQAALDAGFDVR